MKELLIEEIKTLINSVPNERVEINPAYLNYFTQEELLDIKNKLIERKESSSSSTNLYLDEIYEKTKKDKL